MRIEFQLNGQPVEFEADGSMRAVDFLRETCGVCGTKEGCGSGECGGCAIHVDGKTKLSCLMLAAQLNGHEITTIEGMSANGPTPVQQSLANRGGVQCGYCTPGMVMSATELLENNPDPDRQEIREAISGNLCRCTGYHKIVDAVEDAAKTMREGE